MTVTLWADRAKQEDQVFEGNPTVAIKGVAIKEWRDTRGGSLLQSGEFRLSPEFPEAARVQQWWSQGGSSQDLVQLSGQPGVGGGDSGKGRNATHTTLKGLRLASEQLGAQPEVFSVTARLALVQLRKQGEPQPLHYKACQEPKDNGFPCNRRVDESGFCAPCNRVGKTAARLNIRCRFVDFEDQTWLSSFHEGATRILGMSGEEVRALELAAAEKGEGGREELEAAIRSRYFEKPMNVVVRAKMETYNGEARVNCSIIDARPVSHAEQGRRMLKEIHEMLAQ
jgi:replication factor A1